MDWLLRCYDLHTKEMETKLTGITASFEIVKAKLALDTLIAKEKLNTLRAKYEMGEEQVKALVSKHHEKLN